MSEIESTTTESREAETPTRWDRWWRIPSVARGPVVLAIGMVVLVAITGYWRIENVEADSDAAACKLQREFRTFMTGYLDGQVGVPIEEAEGFDELPVEAQTLALEFAPILDAGRAEDEMAAAEYRSLFPIPVCPD